MIEAKYRIGIEGMTDTLVEEAQKFIEETRIFEKDSGMEESQLKHLLELSKSTDSVRAIQNYIFYQIGRYQKTWGYNDFGKKLIDKLDKQVKSWAAQITQQQNNEVWIEMVRLFLGYADRYFVFKKTAGR